MTESKPPISPTLLCINIGGSFYAVVTEVKDAGISPQDYRKLFITEHAHNISLLLGNIALMRTKFQAYATKLIVRPMFEGMFNMIAAMRNPSFAQSKMLSECNDWLRKMRRYREKLVVSGKDTVILDSKIAQLETQSQKWQTDNNVQAREWKTWEICLEAGCTDWYLQYQMLCDDTHAAFSTLSPLNKTTRGNILHQSAFAGANALQQYRNYVDPARQKEHGKEAQDNVARIEEMVKNGSYEQIEWE